MLLCFSCLYLYCKGNLVVEHLSGMESRGFNPQHYTHTHMQNLTFL